MPGRECYHCKQWVEQGEPHDCWTTTESALTRELSEDLREAWERVRETAVEFGEQRIYASHAGRGARAPGRSRSSAARAGTTSTSLRT